MKFRHRKEPAATGRRQVVRGGRPAAFSYHANRTDQDFNLGRLQPREQDNRRRERLVRYWRQRLGMLLAGLVLIVCVLDVLHLSSTPTVVALSSTSNNSFLQSTKVYANYAQKLLAGSILNANKVTINTQAIQTAMKQRFPELSDVSITLPLMGHHPVMYIEPTRPSLLLKASNGDFVLDENGKALLKADQVDNLTRLGLPVITDQSGLKAAPDATVLPSSSVGFIETVVRELKAKNIAIGGLTLPSAAYELDVTPAGAGYYVKFNMHDDSALQQVGTYLAVSQRLSSQGAKPSSYIDVRLSGRAYYK